MSESANTEAVDHIDPDRVPGFRSEPVRIAMWSGPRNISTAMMRSFENRADCAVSDEPFYGCYLARTGLDHPMRDEIIADMDCDPVSVAAAMAGPVPGGWPVWYQKHMAGHCLEGDDLSWLDAVKNCFLIRNPAAVLASYSKKRGNLTAFDIGVLRQYELFEYVKDRTGEIPPVLDANDVLADPEHALSALCAAVGIPFEPAMLSWPKGRRESDGIWAAHWYAAVEESTGFGPPRDDDVALDGALADIVAECRPAYEALYAARLLA